MVQDCVFARSLEFQFGVRRKNWYNPDSAGLDFGERPVPFSELLTLAGSEFRVRTGPNPGSAGLEFGERPVPFSELRTLAGSEFGERTGPNLGLAGSEFDERTSHPWFGRFGVGRESGSFLRKIMEKNENRKI